MRWGDYPGLSGWTWCSHRGSYKWEAKDQREKESIKEVVARTSKTMLNNSGESGHPYLIPDLRGNSLSFSPLRMMFAWVCCIWPLLCWGSNHTPGHIAGENHNLKRYMHPNIHCSTIYNSQDMEAT